MRKGVSYCLNGGSISTKDELPSHSRILTRFSKQSSLSACVIRIGSLLAIVSGLYFQWGSSSRSHSARSSSSSRRASL